MNKLQRLTATGALLLVIGVTAGCGSDDESSGNDGSTEKKATSREDHR
jgi:hypothetical protein